MVTDNDCKTYDIHSFSHVTFWPDWMETIIICVSFTKLNTKNESERPKVDQNGFYFVFTSNHINLFCINLVLCVIKWQKKAFCFSPVRDYAFMIWFVSQRSQVNGLQLCVYHFIQMNLLNLWQFQNNTKDEVKIDTKANNIIWILLIWCHLYT